MASPFNLGTGGPLVGRRTGRYAMSTAGEYDPSKIRNVAIIAHVDHGTTFLLHSIRILLVNDIIWLYR
jgi:hypothetical protein